MLFRGPAAARRPSSTISPSRNRLRCIPPTGPRSRGRSSRSGNLRCRPHCRCVRTSIRASQRQEVNYDGRERAGTDHHQHAASASSTWCRATAARIRYGIGVGRPGFTWAGVKSRHAQARMAGLAPPPEMLKRQPDLPRYMAGGPDNPLGARAMYLGSSLYRIHGSNEPWTIGTGGVVRLHPHAQRGRHRPLRAREGRHQGRGDLSDVLAV